MTKLIIAFRNFANAPTNYFFHISNFCMERYRRYSSGLGQAPVACCCVFGNEHSDSVKISSVWDFSVSRGGTDEDSGI